MAVPNEHVLLSRGALVDGVPGLSHPSPVLARLQLDLTCEVSRRAVVDPLYCASSDPDMEDKATRPSRRLSYLHSVLPQSRNWRG